jgi:D-alanyl-lipoteichoic acid acyltransferase DltB (MBOAT superfamily)
LRLRGLLHLRHWRGLCLGFVLPENFRYPYAAIGFSDFWRRWHITLSTWLRDYLYIPLGGNRQGAGRAYLNLMITMLLGGLWHGASWTFVVWGALHGLFLCVERLLRRPSHREEWHPPRCWPSRLSTARRYCWRPPTKSSPAWA